MTAITKRLADLEKASRVNRPYIVVHENGVRVQGQAVDAIRACHHADVVGVECDRLQGQGLLPEILNYIIANTK